MPGLLPPLLLQSIQPLLHRTVFLPINPNNPIFDAPPALNWSFDIAVIWAAEAKPRLWDLTCCLLQALLVAILTQIAVGTDQTEKERLAPGVDECATAAVAADFDAVEVFVNLGSGCDGGSLVV